VVFRAESLKKLGSSLVEHYHNGIIVFFTTVQDLIIWCFCQEERISYAPRMQLDGKEEHNRGRRIKQWKK